MLVFLGLIWMPCFERYKILFYIGAIYIFLWLHSCLNYLSVTIINIYINFSEKTETVTVHKTGSIQFISKLFSVWG